MIALAASFAASKYFFANSMFFSLYFCHVPSNNMIREVKANTTSRFTVSPFVPSDTLTLLPAYFKSSNTLSITVARAVLGLYSSFSLLLATSCS